MTREPEATSAPVEPHGHGGGHEPDATQTRPLAIGATALAVLLVIGFLVAWFLESAMQRRDRSEGPAANPLAAALGRQLPPEPRLQVNPRRDLIEHRRAEQEVLDSYAWIDRSGGIVRIPIERAMEILAKRGGTAPPAFPGGAPAPAERPR